MGTLAVVIGVGEKTFTVLVPSLGLNQSVFLEDHEHLEVNIVEKGKMIVLRPKHSLSDGEEASETAALCNWDKLNIQLFAKVVVETLCLVCSYYGYLLSKSLSCWLVRPL